MRVDNWLKSVFIFVPLFFSSEIFNIDKLVPTIIAFVAFCLFSSGVYIVNDIFDVKNDIRHPEKCKRPIASGAVSIKNAVIFASVLAVAGGIVSIFLNTMTVSLIAFYVLLNFAYTLYLKRKPIFDCFCIAVGFALRIYIGQTSSGTIVSDWLFLTIVSVSLFMAFGKRRNERLKTSNCETRDVLEH